MEEILTQEPPPPASPKAHLIVIASPQLHWASLHRRYHCGFTPAMAVTSPQLTNPSTKSTCIQLGVEETKSTEDVLQIRWRMTWEEMKPRKGWGCETSQISMETDLQLSTACAPLKSCSDIDFPPEFRATGLQSTATVCCSYHGTMVSPHLATRDPLAQVIRPSASPGRRGEKG